MAKTKIPWTNRTWNPTRGCRMVGTECRDCYAMPTAHYRLSGPGRPYDGLTVLGPSGPVWNGKVRLPEHKLEEPLDWKQPSLIFVDSMSDLFYEEVPTAFIERVADVMRAAQWHVFQILTKRSQRMRQMLSTCLRQAAQAPHIWWGVSCGIRKDGLPRVDDLRTTPCAVRFLSLEPLLEDLGEIDLRGVHWVIAGGESGPRARPMEIAWARSIRNQCTAWNVPFFFKQGSQANWKDFRNFTSFPRDLQIREYPDYHPAKKQTEEEKEKA